MSSIRPLVTITILVVVGAFLYVKINEGPVAPPVPGDKESSQSPVDVPPLAAAPSAATGESPTAPLWPNTAAAVPPVTAAAPSESNIAAAEIAPPVASATTAAYDIAAGTPSAVPAIPELPTVPTVTDVTAASTANSLPIANAVPTNIPTAQYPGQTPTTNVVDVMAPQTTAQVGMPASASTGTLEADPSTVLSPINSDLPGLPDVASQSSNPLRPATISQDVTSDNPATTAGPVSTASTEPMAASFAASWPTIQSALDRGDLALAHQLLSPWHDVPSLSPVEEHNVKRLLGQLAGSVIYSTEHRLRPAHIVMPGESLETIAKEYNVPWQLLAKINGIPGSDQVRPGQELKVVPGPFSAVVDLGRSELTLQVAGRYAGKFPVTVPIGAAVSEGEWLVDQKLVAPASGVTQSAYTTEPPKVDHAIVLRGNSEAAAAAVGPTLAISSSSNPTGAGANAAAIQISANDAEELSDILSIGSRVVIRR